jgi:SPP1 gp7 family putative phage head morphogenesis protein
MKINKTAKDLWRPKRRIELLYQRSLRTIMKKIESKLKSLTKLEDILKVLKSFTKTKEFQQHAEAAARKMVTSTFSDEGKAWRAAANANSKSRQIYEAMQNEMITTNLGVFLKEQTERNAKLITGIPKKVSEEITDYIARRTTEGRRAQDISEELQSIYPKLLKNKADLIARTEVSKTQSAITQERSQRIGLNWYIWRTSDDSRVRSSHKHMEGVLINWNDPPSPEVLNKPPIKSTLGKYNAGCCPNCRCYSEVLIKVNFLNWDKPRKVYYHGQIVRMTKKQFENIM